MTIAVFIKDIYLSRIIGRSKHVFIFEIENEIITAVGEELMKIKDINYICLWLLGKKIGVIYSDDFSKKEQLTLKRAGIIVRSLNDIKNNPILEALLVKNNS